MALLSPKRFEVIRLLGDDTVWIGHVVEQLGKNAEIGGREASTDSMYQMIVRMERDGLISSKMTQVPGLEEGQLYKVITVTAAGFAEYGRTQAFYGAARRDSWKGRVTAGGSRAKCLV